MQWHLLKLMLTNFRWVKFIEFVFRFVFFLNQEKSAQKVTLDPLCSYAQNLSQ